MSTPAERTAPQLTDEDLEVAMAVISQPLQEEVTELATLTDEELRAVDGFAVEPTTPLPWLEKNAATTAQQQLATAVAMRSLMARGLVVSSALTEPWKYEDGSREPMTFETVPELRAVAVLRRTPDRVLLAERRTEQGTTRAFFYVFELEEERRILLEVFDQTGFHLFYLLRGADLLAQFLLVVDPKGVVGDEDSEPVEVPAAQFSESETAQRLAAARAMSQILVMEMGSAEAEAFTILALPDHLELLESDEEQAVTRVGAISRESLGDLLDQLLVAADDA